MVTKKYDDDTLIAGLEKLTGNDFNACEMAERRSGNMHSDLAFSKSFQARLAARALKEDLGIIKALPMYDYNQLCWVVGSFLQFGSSGSGDIGSIYRRLAARLRDYGPAAYWMSLTLEELSYWLDDIMEVVKDEQEAITEAREEAANNR